MRRRSSRFVAAEECSGASIGFGQHQRGLEFEGSIRIIEMGARQYSPALGRFLEVDPVEGGSANDYDYAAGDPINSSDPTGRFFVIAIPVAVVVAVVAAALLASVYYAGKRLAKAVSSVRLPSFSLPKIRWPWANKASRSYGEWVDGLDRAKSKGGRPRWVDGTGRKKRTYEWDPSHGGEVEGYDRLGNHIGVYDPETGEKIKDAVPGRTLDD